MAKILGNFHLALGIGVALLLARCSACMASESAWRAIGRNSCANLHILAGILWIGLLYYFNFGASRPAERFRPN